MTTPSNLLGLAALYICALFAIAWAVDRRGERRGGAIPPSLRATVYVLSLGVYCSSWTFYGAVGSAAASPWSHAPIYLGPILLFLLGWPLLRRLVMLGPRHRVTSIADYLGARFGKRQALSVLVTLVAVASVLPYVALQFRALTQAWNATLAAGSAAPADALDPSLVIAIVLAVFAILFGARRMDGRERHPGLMSAIAVESVVKLLAFTAIALLACAYLAKGNIAESLRVASPTALRPTADFFAQIFVSACAVLCLPRQFHALVVEAPDGPPVSAARWVFPAYLALFMVLVVPVSIAGAQLAEVVAAAPPDSPDVYVQWLPRTLDAPLLFVVAFVGGISAATGMVIVATVSLAIMLTNELALPLMIRRRAAGGAALLALGNRIRLIRQVTIILILLAAWLVATQLERVPWLSEIGFVSFLAAAQLAPGILAGLYWRRAHGVAVMVGLLAGLALWVYCLVLPTVLSAEHGLLQQGPFGLAWLRPDGLFGIESQAALSYATLWSLGVNGLFVVCLSFLLRPSPGDLRQVAVFMGGVGEAHGGSSDEFELSPIRAGQLLALLPPFIDGSRLRELWRFFEDRYQQRLLPADRLPLFALRAAESELAGVIGAASAQRVLDQLASSRQVNFSDLASLVSDAGRQQTFNRALLESTIESMPQGVAVVDAELRLVAWNSRYEELFAYPQRMLYVGLPISRLYRYNAERGVLDVGRGSIDAEVEKRLAWLRRGLTHRFERRLPDGRVIDIHGQPMPEGGIVTTYTDITEFREMVTELTEARAELENRLESGSRSLSDTNAQLRRENRLRAEAESKLREANLSKSRFMSATSHDLLQPINAARLFAASLRQRADLDEAAEATVASIDRALGRAEQLISELREIARLDSGRRQPSLATFAADALLRELYAEFAPEARRRGLRLRLRSSGLWLHSDRQLLARALQNLLANALKYSRAGTVLVGLRRRGALAEIQVIDQGPGVPLDSQAKIFEEFERLSSSSRSDALSGNGEGLGLGLSIVRRYAELLGLRLRFESVPGRGSLFSLAVPTAAPRTEAQPETSGPRMDGRLRGISVLCIDNDSQVREALAAILTAEGCRVSVEADRHGLRDTLRAFRPDVVLADYHLDDGDTGLAALQWALRGANRNVPCVIISADDSSEVREAARSAGYRILPKPINPTRLTALILALAGDAAAGALPSGSPEPAPVPQEG
ncbi:MAG: PAS-domain containing protein [Halieaceae bacterium]|jgi:Na+/proline symporter/signal transduction histidine kinase/CheY-like chemotaxis protein|nr:PAS-domain containing protein [Halieaceae bacterium]